MRKILITGAGGFIGSHVAEACVRNGWGVKAFVRYNSRNYWGWLESSEVKEDLEIYTGDIRDFDSVRNGMKDCDGVFHLAALIGIPYSYVSPLAYVKTNVEGTYNILQAALELNAERVLITSTSETYGTAQYVPINESHPLVAQSPYSASKIAADQLAISYYSSFNLPVRIIRPFNTYGPRQSSRAIIPTIISQILAGEKRLKLGNLTPTRDLTYVEDTVAAFVKVAEADNTVGEVINIGSNFEISIGALAEKILSLMGKDNKIISVDERFRPENSEVGRLWADNSKVKKLIGWEPTILLEDGLKRTIEWMKENLNRYKVGIYNV